MLWGCLIDESMGKRGNLHSHISGSYINKLTHDDYHRNCMTCDPRPWECGIPVGLLRLYLIYFYFINNLESDEKNIYEKRLLQ